MESSIAPANNRESMFRLANGTAAGFFPSKITGLASTLLTRSASLEFSNVCTPAISIPALGSGWPYATVSWSAMEGESGSNPNRAEGQPSFSPAPSEALHRYLIALIEDNPADAFLVQEAITNHHISASVVVIRDGDTAIRAIGAVDADENALQPNLFLLDLNLPTRTGEEVLARIRNSRRLSTTPVIVMTSSGSPKDRATAESLGASRFFCKPSDYDSFMQLGEVIEEMLTRVELS